MTCETLSNPEIRGFVSASAQAEIDLHAFRLVGEPARTVDLALAELAGELGDDLIADASEGLAIGCGLAFAELIRERIASLSLHGKGKA
jgi:hypothetical protein